MQFISNNWYWFLIVTVVFSILTISNQIARMRRMVKFDGDFTSVMNGMGIMMMWAVLATVSGVLTLLGIVLVVIDHIKHS